MKILGVVAGRLPKQSEISQNDDLSLDFAAEEFGVKETSDSPNANTKKKAPPISLLLLMTMKQNFARKSLHLT